MIPWEIYGIITHDSSLHVNLPLDLPEQCDTSMQQQFNKWHKKKKKKTLRILTHGTMRGRGLTSTMVCINDKTRDIREKKM